MGFGNYSRYEAQTLVANPLLPTEPFNCNRDIITILSVATGVIHILHCHFWGFIMLEFGWHSCYRCCGHVDDIYWTFANITHLLTKCCKAADSEEYFDFWPPTPHTLKTLYMDVPLQVIKTFFLQKSIIWYWIVYQYFIFNHADHAETIYRNIIWLVAKSLW